jgi:hypothetical protein
VDMPLGPVSHYMSGPASFFEGLRLDLTELENLPSKSYGGDAKVRGCLLMSHDAR